MASSSKKIVAGIDIGSHMTRVIVAEESVKLGVPPKILGIGYSETLGMRHGYILSPREATVSILDAVRMAEKTTGVEIKRAYVSIGGVGLASEIAGGAVSIARPDGEVTEDDITNVMGVAKQVFNAQKKNIKILHTIPLKYRLDGLEVMGNPIGMRGSRLEIRMVFIMVLEHHFNELVSVVTDAGIDIIEVVASPIAESLATLNRRQKMVGCGLLNMGAETTSLIVFDNDLPVSVAVFPLGSNDITNDIALGLQINLEEAEYVKLTGEVNGKNNKKKNDEIIKARALEIFETIQHHLKLIKRDGLLPAGIILTGGGGVLRNLDDFARSALKLPATIVHADLIMNTRRDLDSSWLVAYGLCFLEDSDAMYGTKVLKSAFKETKKGIMKFLKEFLP